MSSAKKTDVEGAELVQLLKDAGLFTTKDGKPWFRIKVVAEPKAGEEPSVVEFADAGPRSFMGYAFSDKVSGQLFLAPPDGITKFLKSKKLELVYNSAEPHVTEKEAKYGPAVTYGYYTVVGSKSETVKRLAEEIESSDTIINLSSSKDVQSKMTRDLVKIVMHGSDPDEIFGTLVANIDDVTNTNRDALTAIADAIEMFLVEAKGPAKAKH